MKKRKYTGKIIKIIGLFITLSSIGIKIFYFDNAEKQRRNTESLINSSQMMTFNVLLNDLIIFGNTDFKKATIDIASQAMQHNNITAYVIEASKETSKQKKEYLIQEMNRRCLAVKTFEEYQLFRQYCQNIRDGLTKDFQKQYLNEEKTMGFGGVLIILFTIIGMLFIILGEIRDIRDEKQYAFKK